MTASAPRRAVASPARRVLTAGCLVVATAVFLATVPLHRDFFDVAVYYGAVDDWVHGGRIYDYLKPGTRYGFTYPPFAAVAMAPMALVSWPVAVATSIALSAVASALLLHWLAVPVVRRALAARTRAAGEEGKEAAGHEWFTLTVVGCLFALLEPVRDTFSFGQVNLVLVALVLADARLLATGRGRYAGIGIGLATAVKLTPGLFVVYLLITGRRRQAAIATATAGGATLLAALVDPAASRAFWTDALWHTDRVGALGYVSNQSLQGVLARLQPDHPSRALWAACVLVVLAVWAYRARAAVRAGDDRAGFALTGLAACLVSPVTWVHHLVWLIPALIVLADAASAGPDGGRRVRPGVCVALYVVLCSSVVWLWRWDSTGPDAFLGANAYVWITLGLLFVPPRTRHGRGVVTDGAAATR
ncbi:glycosyltransferase 87 family protein [Streptomyces sp. JV176]|uniref:glycosyltransferase 87 family protein n=1 Tax=Streptomyces sp. JV176 TaxID=858630 RepID=UPI002E76C795|nr:glycosyltransferase 87 family protein [Streptomyces sp. JV176]MEE1798527.1 glycosyltransferase 87 family protein [Streptomyces sp. JV176]